MKRLFCACLLVACGGESSLPPSSDTVVPVSWSAGERFAAIAIETQRVDPFTLGEGACSLRTQIAQAETSGELTRTDEEGPCIVTSEVPDLVGAPGLSPLCVGTLDLEVGSFRQTFTLCDILPDPASLDCADVDGATDFMLRSFADEREGDVLGDGELALERGRAPRVMSPESRGDGAAVWPEGPLVVGWPGLNEASMEIVLQDRSGSGPSVRCYVDDSGRFEMPERLVAPYRSQIVSLEVARITQVRGEIDGVDIRLSDRQSDAIQIFPSGT